MKKIKIGLDIDGVIANFDKGIFDFLDKPYVESTEWDSPFISENFHLVKMNPNFWLSLKPLIDPKKIDFDVHCYITQREIPSYISYRWLIENGFPDRPVFSVGPEGKDETIKHTGTDVFVDDRYSTFINLHTKGIKSFLYHAKYNENEEDFGKRIKCLSELKNKIYES